MRKYVKGDRVEVLNTNGTLEYSWHPACVVRVHRGGMCSVVYDGHVNGVVEERVLVKCIRPCPPLVEFENWCRGDLVHVFDEFSWKLGTVLEVLEKKQFSVRVVGSMKNLKVGIAWIRVRHYWQGDHWIVVGKGPSRLNAQLQDIPCDIISDLQPNERNTSLQTARISTRLRNQKAFTKAGKRSVVSILDQTDTQRSLRKVRRTTERTSCTVNLNQTVVYTGTAMRSNVNKKHQFRSLIHAPATNTSLKEQQYEILEDSGSSSVGSCSPGSNCLSYYNSSKCPKPHTNDDLSDAESCTMPSPKRRNLNTILDRPAKGCGMILRFRLKDPLLQGAAL